MMSLRIAEGTRLDWIDTRLESGFSNFLFIDQRYGAHPVMRRIFSLARKHDFRSVLIEQVDSSRCALLAEEDAALSKRKPGFTGSRVHRFGFFRSLPDEPVGPGDFLGSAIYKSDSFSGLSQPRSHVYEALLPPPRGASDNSFLHCMRTHEFRTSVGDFSAAGVLYAQQNNLTFVCAHIVSLRRIYHCCWRPACQHTRSFGSGSLLKTAGWQVIRSSSVEAGNESKARDRLVTRTLRKQGGRVIRV